MTANHRRKGITLIELVTSMSLSVIVLGILSVLLSSVVHSTVASRRHLADVVALGRLSEQFRRDVHEGRTIESSGNSDQVSSLVIVDGSGRRVEYAITSGGSVRRTLSGQSAAPPEVFVLKRLIARSLATSGSNPTRVSLELAPARRPDGRDEPRIGSFLVSARLGAYADPTANEREAP